jgi:hypothetical protein
MLHQHATKIEQTTECLLVEIRGMQELVEAKNEKIKGI